MSSQENESADHYNKNATRYIAGRAVTVQQESNEIERQKLALLQRGNNHARTAAIAAIIAAIAATIAAIPYIESIISKISNS